MFQEVRVPILGIIENMSYLSMPDGSRLTPFGSGGGAKLAAEIGVELLGEIPIAPEVSACGDAGEPIVRKMPEHGVSKAYISLAKRVLTEMGRRPQSAALPSVQL
jgi:ATP-binding protein involved in chromosome partitioning